MRPSKPARHRTLWRLLIPIVAAGGLLVPAAAGAVGDEASLVPFSGVVHDEDGSPLGEVSLAAVTNEITDGRWCLGTRTPATSAADGTFTALVEPGGEYRVSVEDRTGQNRFPYGFLSDADQTNCAAASVLVFAVPAGGLSGLVLTVSDNGQISLTVNDALYWPVAGTTVSAELPDGTVVATATSTDPYSHLVLDDLDWGTPHLFRVAPPAPYVAGYVTSTLSVTTSRDEAALWRPGDLAGYTINVAADDPYIPGVNRLAGPDRYATSAAVSAAHFSPGQGTVYVASGRTFPDALGAAAAARWKAGPVLLVARDSIPEVIAAELDRLDPVSIKVVGGTPSVSDAVVAALAQYTSGTVTRISGPDRYATSAAISAEAWPYGAPGFVYVVSGTSYPDALTAASADLYALAHAPVLLVKPTGIPSSVAAELDRLNPNEIVVVGGPASVSDPVLTALKRYTVSYSDVSGTRPGRVTRIAGANRYQTAAAVSAASYNAGIHTAYVANGLDFPDALSGSAVAGPLLLVTPTGIPASTAAELDRLAPRRIIVLGGPASVSDQVRSDLATHLAD